MNPAILAMLMMLAFNHDVNAPKPKPKVGHDDKITFMIAQDSYILRKKVTLCK